MSKNQSCHLQTSLNLTSEELATLSGKYGHTRQKLMRTMVLYAEALGADRLVEIEGPGHLVITDSRSGWGARLEFLEEVAAAGLKTTFPFTIDPPAPYRDRALDLTPEQKAAMDNRYAGEDRYRELMLELGLRDDSSATCTPWFKQVGNHPEFGQVVAWAESSAVVFVNSVLGARTHRNAGVVELISNLVGKTPNAGLITDDGRKSNWLVEVAATVKPDPQVLGHLIGSSVLDGVPYMVGLDKYLSPTLDGPSLQFLHDLGTNCAVSGGVGLFHVENITPEALASGRDLLRNNANYMLIDDERIEAAVGSIHSALTPEQIKPDKCLVGCPHLTLDQLHTWTDMIGQALQRSKREALAVETIFVAAPNVINAFKNSGDAYDRLTGWGIRLSSFCLEGLMQDRAISPGAVVTNSNKLRHYNTGVYYFNDRELAEIIVVGKVSERVRNEYGV